MIAIHRIRARVLGANMRFSLLAMIVSTIVANNGEAQPASFLPEPVQKCFATVDVLSVFAVNKDVHPTWVRGYFDGTAAKSYAVLLVNKQTGKRIVAICRDNAKAPDLIGTDYRLPESGRYLEGFKSWRVAPAKEANLKVDALEFSNTEDWCGGHYVQVYFSGSAQTQYELDDTELDCD